MALKEFYKGKRVFLTYPTSFLGAWTAYSLKYLGAEVFGFASKAAVSPNLFDLTNLGNEISMTYGDFRDLQSLKQAVEFSQADIFIHLGESRSLNDAKAFAHDCFSESVLSTINIMELLRETATVRSMVVVSSDKVYKVKNNEPFLESDPVASGDILPTARLCSEMIALSYRHSFFNPEKYNKHKIAIATARLEAGIGGGEFGEGSLIADAVKAFSSNAQLELRNPQSQRPWIHVADQAAGILLLAAHLYGRGPKAASTYNLGSNLYKSVGETMNEFAQVWQAPLSELPLDMSPSLHGRLNSELAKKDFNWQPQLDLQQTLKDITRWYKAHQAGMPVSAQMNNTLEKIFAFSDSALY
ncbi:NAD-dependent epimerase/dehydratase family protein [Bdellovibrio reynosensis]|uniref:NAD-dependent epimerase/dehydratase family protein n=1 Tax=Bdellovibrio reynosensis TaxID=2835041 RepID=A0ABY4CCU0_9BACT|nr:NAD-dependent epimerase/dehydratase family protein [Bdellovibrio reynosensis]UOF02264.1 NAD-dependent epimerase/dehydratase family protein [Bdellovibrio reynosensis]